MVFDRIVHAMRSKRSRHPSAVSETLHALQATLMESVETNALAAYQVRDADLRAELLRRVDRRAAWAAELRGVLVALGAPAFVRPKGSLRERLHRQWMLVSHFFDDDKPMALLGMLQRDDLDLLADVAKARQLDVPQHLSALLEHISDSLVHESGDVRIGPVSDDHVTAPPQQAHRVTDRARARAGDPQLQGSAAMPSRSGGDKWDKIERAPTVGPM